MPLVSIMFKISPDGSYRLMAFQFVHEVARADLCDVMTTNLEQLTDARCQSRDVVGW